jgi:hypothetical protein
MSAGGTDLQTVLATFLPRYLESRALHPRQRQVCAHIGTCRTPALGGQRLRCESAQCDYEIPRYHSCRDRHCPKCQGRASAKWCERQLARVLPVPYYHLVFTLPDSLNPWVQAEPALVYHQLFQSAWATLQAFARNPKHLGGEPGMTGVLHTWGQTLIQHVHLHCLVPGGALSAQGTWRAANGSYLFPSRALSRRFRGHFVSALRRHAQAGALERVGGCADIDAMLDGLMAKDWVVYAKPCVGKPERVVGYLGRYTHRIALSDRRLIGIDATRVGLRYTDYRDGGRHKTTWLDGTELVRRFLLHVLPKGLMRIRHYGFLANRCWATRACQIRRALAMADAPTPKSDDATTMPDTEPCPRCRTGRLRVVAILAPHRFEPG